MFWFEKKLYPKDQKLPWLEIQYLPDEVEVKSALGQSLKQFEENFLPKSFPKLEKEAPKKKVVNKPVDSTDLWVNSLNYVLNSNLPRNSTYSYSFELPCFTPEYSQEKSAQPKEPDCLPSKEVCGEKEVANFLKPFSKDSPIENPLTLEEKENKESFPFANTEAERASITPTVQLNHEYSFPSNIFFKKSNPKDYVDFSETQSVIKKLEETLNQFGIEGQVIGIQRGPIITRYELKLAPGIKVSRILALTDELAMAIEALRVRIEAPIPGRSTVGIEIPNKNRSMVRLGDIVQDPLWQSDPAELPLPLGKDIAGNIVIVDLTKLPHLLIAGTTGSGKSVIINSFITSLILKRTPEEIRFLLIDPKLVELSHYNDIPHLLHPVITDPQKAILALNWAVEEMERRYEDLAEMRVREIKSYNLRLRQLQNEGKLNLEEYPPMPYIVILIDELGDLMLVAGKEVESSIIRLSQKARAVGIHLILATQRPSVDVITALIKANCPARIALQVAQKTDSRTILDANGAEQLVGQGDLLFKHPNRGDLMRIQAPFVEDEEVEAVVEFAKKLGKPQYITLEDPQNKSSQLEPEDEVLFQEAWQIILESGKASASYLQRRLRIGYNRAARLIEAFEARGMIGPQIGSKPREILQK